MAEIEFSPASLMKLQNIHDYIALNLVSPQAAQNTVSRILSAIEKLRQFPECGPRLKLLHEQLPERFNQTRLLVTGNHVTIYDFQDSTVQVLQIYHCSEDYIQHLFQALS